LNGTEKRVTETGTDGEAGQLAQINFRKAIAQHFVVYTPNFAACREYLEQHFTWHLQLVMAY